MTPVSCGQGLGFARGVVTTVVSLVEYRSARGGLDPTVADIVKALKRLSGVAHREVVADLIIGNLRPARPEALRAEREAIFKSFADYVGVAVRRRTPPLLHTPLGEGSYRWALTAAGLTLFDDAPHVLPSRALR